MPQPGDEEEADGQQQITNPYRPCYNILPPVEVKDHDLDTHIFCALPLLGPLLFDNVDSDCRDHCANERTFLSYLRLSIYMAVVSIAIVISFHLKHQPTELELKIARPLGLVFWFLALACLAMGLGNYIKTVTKYSRRAAIVQTGWKTQVGFTLIAIAIVGICILLLSTNSQK